MAFDIDGVICFSKSSDYQNAIPNHDAIKKINSLFAQGHEIIIFTARYMGRTNNKPEEAKKLGYDSTFKQLKLWKLKFNKLVFGKPSYDILVDDKAFNYSKDWINKIN